MAVWHRVEFGSKLDKECHGCARKINLQEPVSLGVRVAPPFSDKCPLRVEGSK
jgi:hypothetical protein